MSRHRNVRSMDITDEYEGYDDVYGHSVEDDYCVSPSAAAFMYDRESSRDHQKISAYLKKVKDIEEEDEVDEQMSNLSPVVKEKLDSYINEIRSMLDKPKSREEIEAALLSNNFNIGLTVNALSGFLPQPSNVPEKKAKDFKTKFFVPKLSGDALFTIPKLNFGGAHAKQTDKFPRVLKTPQSLDDDSHESLADLANEHLKTIPTLNANPETNVQKTKSLNLLTNPVDPVDTNWHIDLTVALRNTASAPLIKKRPETEEKFDLPFIDCEISGDRVARECELDITNALRRENFRLARKASKFGCVLCRKYRCVRRARVGASRDGQFESLKRFAFATPSPDDLILVHLRRK